MKKEIILLVDYKGNFGSKHNAKPYRSGMDKALLTSCFEQYDLNVIYIYFADVVDYDTSFWKDKFIVYTSSEDKKYYYKSYIEDIIYYIELLGARVVPSYKYLKANNNKVFMELLRKSYNNKSIASNQCKVFGAVEELNYRMASLTFPVVYKPASGAMSKGVGLATNKRELLQGVNKIASTKNRYNELHEKIRAFKHQDYTVESQYRNKFIVQNFIPNLSGDYKVLIFGSKYYVLKRDAKSGDFRASGSGIRNFVKEIPDGILAFAQDCFNVFNVPHVSIDIAYDGKRFYLIEFQCLFFGSYTLTYSQFYWQRLERNNFKLIEGTSVLENEYVLSIVGFLKG
jgi:glutathione synthase/RimK-type ligase-like ATP-grasp enzyme